MIEPKNLFIYDWDDNIMIMPSILHLEKLIGTKWVQVNVSPSKYRKLKNDPKIRYGGDSFFDFRDDRTFLQQLAAAINDESFGPSFQCFKQALVNGEDFAILTARGHSREMMIAGVMMIVMRTFSIDEITEMVKNVHDIGVYLSEQEYFTVSSKEFNEEFGTTNDHWTIGEKKKIALHRHINERLEYYKEFVIDDFNVVFSDDDSDYVNAASELFYVLKVVHPNVEFKIFDTSNKKRKEIVI